jgi:hypothetical protein
MTERISTHIYTVYMNSTLQPENGGPTRNASRSPCPQRYALQAEDAAGGAAFRPLLPLAWFHARAPACQRRIFAAAPLSRGETNRRATSTGVIRFSGRRGCGRREGLISRLDCRRVRHSKPSMRRPSVAAPLTSGDPHPLLAPRF